MILHQPDIKCQYMFRDMPEYVEEPYFSSVFNQAATLKSKKVRLSIGLYCLPRMQEIVVTVATANIMGPHAVLKQSKNRNILMALPST